MSSNIIYMNTWEILSLVPLIYREDITKHVAYALSYFKQVEQYNYMWCLDS